jgi:hypothetical protein
MISSMRKRTVTGLPFPQTSVTHKNTRKTTDSDERVTEGYRESTTFKDFIPRGEGSGKTVTNGNFGNPEGSKEPHSGCTGGGWVESPKPPPVPPEALLADPPAEWLAKQLQKCRANPDSLFKPTAAISSAVYGSPERGPEVAPLLEAHIRGAGACGAGRRTPPRAGVRLRMVRVMSGAPLYLHLQALGLRLALQDQPEHPDGCVVQVYDIDRLEDEGRERVRGLVRANKAALLALLRSGSPDALAVGDASGRDACRYSPNGDIARKIRSVARRTADHTT